jgi:hypothetical protein
MFRVRLGLVDILSLHRSAIGTNVPPNRWIQAWQRDFWNTLRIKCGPGKLSGVALVWQETCLLPQIQERTGGLSWNESWTHVFILGLLAWKQTGWLLQWSDKDLHTELGTDHEQMTRQTTKSVLACTVFNKFGSTAITCPWSLQILYCQKKLFCTLQRIHSSVALLPDYLVKKSLQFWRGLDCSMQASVFQLCKKTAMIARY